MSAYSVEVEIRGLPIVLANSRLHWARKAKEIGKWKAAVKNALMGMTPSEPLTKAKITLTRCSSIEPDFDNLAGSFKGVLDGLKEAGVILDDRQSVIGCPEFKWEKTSPRAGRIRIKVEASV